MNTSAGPAKSINSTPSYIRISTVLTALFPSFSAALCSVASATGNHRHSAKQEKNAMRGIKRMLRNRSLMVGVDGLKKELQTGDLREITHVGSRKSTTSLRLGASLGLHCGAGRGKDKNTLCVYHSRIFKMNQESPNSLTVGTRGSELALVQATHTEALLAVEFPNLQLDRRIIKTTGDRRTDVTLADVAKAEGIFDKGVFIKELEQALDDGEIDIAVHSLKDLPTVLDERFALAAVLKRAPVRDVLVTRDGYSLDSLPESARLGTSSVRRTKQAAHLRPDLKIVDLRGNVPTRLQKLSSGEHHDAILLAEAGLVRLGYLPEIGEPNKLEPVIGMPGLFACRLDESLFYPAAGQGAIGLEIRSDDARSCVIAEAIGHPDTWRRVTAEREFLRLLDAGCHTPVGVYSSLSDSELHLKALVFSETDGPPRYGEARGADPLIVALSLFQSLT